jgi:hypothetical protein
MIALFPTHSAEPNQQTPQDACSNNTVLCRSLHSYNNISIPPHVHPNRLAGVTPRGSSPSQTHWMLQAAPLGQAATTRGANATTHLGDLFPKRTQPSCMAIEHHVHVVGISLWRGDMHMLHPIWERWQWRPISTELVVRERWKAIHHTPVMRYTVRQSGC